MTSGSPMRHILAFALPVLLGNILQQLYNLVDTVIIGRMDGVTAQAAVSSSGWLYWSVISLATGLAEGFCIAIAQRFGAGDHHALRHDEGQSVLLSAAAAVLLLVLSESFLAPVLRLMKTPAETFGLTCLYLRIIFVGIPIIMGFNLTAGLLRSVGDSRTPLIAMIVTTFLNIGLDILFVGTFRWSVLGVALATTASQLLAFLICLFSLRRMTIMRLSRNDLKADRRAMIRLIRLACPIALQYLVISVGGLVLQSAVNSFGFIFMAGYSAAGKLQGLMEMAGTSVASALGTFTGQNYGAGKPDRVRKGVSVSIFLCTVIAAIVAGLALLWGRQLLSLFMQDDPAIVEQVLDVGSRFLVYMCIGIWFLFMLLSYRSALQGMGQTFTAMVSGIVELVMRVGAALFLPKLIGEDGLFLSEVLAWSGGALWLWLNYLFFMRRRPDLKENA